MYTFAEEAHRDIFFRCISLFFLLSLLHIPVLCDNDGRGRRERSDIPDIPVLWSVPWKIVSIGQRTIVHHYFFHLHYISPCFVVRYYRLLAFFSIQNLIILLFNRLNEAYYCNCIINFYANCIDWVRTLMRLLLHLEYDVRCWYTNIAGIDYLEVRKTIQKCTS